MNHLYKEGFKGRSEIEVAIREVSNALVQLTATAEAVLDVLDSQRDNDPKWLTSSMRTALVRDITRAHKAFKV